MSFLVAIHSISSADAAGRTVTTAVNTILNGKGAPKSSLGTNGDFYIDTRSLQMYGPKRNGKWPTPQNLQGPTGPAGVAGRNGADGKIVTQIAASNAMTGAVGAQGEKGDKGEKGDQGEKGERGETGTAGTPGPPGIPGAVGATGATGATGAQGPQGIQGAPGQQGAPGATGPSEVSVVDIPSWTLATNSIYGYSNSKPVGELLISKNYQFQIFVSGASTSYNLALGLDLTALNCDVSFNYIKRENWVIGNNDSAFKYTFFISGTVSRIQVNSGISIRVIDAYGETAAAPLTLSGKAYITLVGSVR